MKDRLLGDGSSGLIFKGARRVWMTGDFCAWAGALGCSNLPLRTAPRGPTFANLYREFVPVTTAPGKTANQTKVSMSAEGMPLVAFLRHVCDQAGMSVIVEQGLESRTVTLEVREQPANEVLSLVARRLGVNLRNDGDLYFVGQLRPEDRGVLVRRVRRLDREQLNQAIGVFGGEHGRAAQFADGLVIVGDTVEVLARVNEMLDLVEAAESPVWIVQLHLVSYAKQAADELGINVEPAAKAGLAFAAGSSASGANLELAASLEAVLQVAYSRDDVSVTAVPMFLVADGDKATFVQGDRIPIPRRTISPEGTVTTSGYEYVQTGVNVELTLREVAVDAARVELQVGMSDVKRMVEEAPVTGEERFQTASIVKAGGVYLLGTLVKDRLQARRGFGWQSGDYRNQQAQVVQVWAQSYRIGAALAHPTASRREQTQIDNVGRTTPDQ